MNDEKNKGATDGMVLPKDGLRELALFAGAGGGILGGLLHGWRTVAAVEIEDYPRRVLLQRQADGILPRFPIWDDVCTFDGHPWKGKVDVISGGFPCQDISCAWKGAGIEGERSSMWKHMARIIGEVRPSIVFVENSPMLVGRGLTTVLGDLAEMGYDAKWGIVGADFVGAPHRRERFWLVAHSRSNRLEDWSNKRHNLHREKICQDKSKNWHGVWSEANKCLSTDDWKAFASEFLGVDDGLASRLDRLKAIGNGQVPACAALAWSILSGESNG